VNTVLETQTANVKIKCHTSDDRVKLFVDLRLPEDSEDGDCTQKPRPDKESLYKEVLQEISSIISSSRVNVAVLRHAVEQLLEGEEVVNRRIAKGKEAKPPRDGRLVFLVKKISRTAEVSEEAAESKTAIDPRSLRLFENVENGQEVVRVYPPKKGAPGEDAFGKAIESEMGKEIEYSVDETLRSLPAKKPKTYTSITSLTEGYLAQEGSKLSVSNELQINGDVDYSTGNIDFIGSVTITGSVRPGFSVKAKKDILLQGYLEGGHLISSEGSITVEKLVTAGGRSRIQAAKDVTVSVAQGATIRAGRLLSVTKEARNCKLHSYSQIDMANAELLGGSVYAICGIEAKSFGNEHGVNTNIFFCSDIEMDPGFRKLLSDIAQHEQALTVLRSHLGPYAQQPARIIFLNDDLKERMLKMLRRYTSIAKSYQRLQSVKESKLEGAKHSTTATVSFSEALYPGVTVENNDAVFSSNKVLKGPKSIAYDEDEHRFSVAEYQAVVCSFRSNLEDASNTTKVPTGSSDNSSQAEAQPEAAATNEPKESAEQEQKTEEKDEHE
jgi:hypothetical protein